MNKVNKKLSFKDCQIQNESIEWTNQSKKIIQQYFLQIVKIEPETAKLILARILNILNQGESFDSCDLKNIICGISKLFQCNNVYLRRMIYKVLKVMMDQQFSYIFTQSIIRDLMCTNQFIRLNAMKIIPSIKDESIMFQLQKYIGAAINDQNTIISSTALIAAFNLLNRFPNIVEKSSSQIIEKLTVQCDVYAFNLICSMKQVSLSKFINILHQLIKQSQNQIMKIQIIRAISKISAQNKSGNIDQLLDYVKSQVYYQEPMVFFEVIKQLILIDNLTNLQLQPFIKILFNNLQNVENNIEIFTALRIIKNILLIPKRKQLIVDQQLQQIQDFIFSPHQSISSIAIFNLILSYQNNMIAENFKQLYSKRKQILQINFLSGLLELITRTGLYLEQIIEFLNTAISEDSEDQIIFLAIQIIDLIMKHQGVILLESVKPLFRLTENQVIDLKLFAIQVIHEIYFKSEYNISNSTTIKEHYEYLKDSLYNNLVSNIESIFGEQSGFQQFSKVGDKNQINI
ncbi:hypothetical protein pb186bvf_020240 [Paramecium bursaria]